MLQAIACHWIRFHLLQAIRNILLYINSGIFFHVERAHGPGEALWPHDASDSELAQASPQPGQAKQHQEVLRSFVSTFCLFTHLAFSGGMCVWRIKQKEERHSDVFFLSCRWRFVFYLSAFTAGLAFLIDVRCPIFFFTLGKIISLITVHVYGFL